MPLVPGGLGTTGIGNITGGPPVQLVPRVADTTGGLGPQAQAQLAKGVLVVGGLSTASVNGAPIDTVRYSVTIPREGMSPTTKFMTGAEIKASGKDILDASKLSALQNATFRIVGQWGGAGGAAAGGAPTGAATVGGAAETKPAETKPAETALKTGVPVVLSPTTGKDIYNVKYLHNGVYVQGTMTGDAIRAKGGTIPEKAQEESTFHQDVMSKGITKAKTLQAERTKAMKEAKAKPSDAELTPEQKAFNSSHMIIGDQAMRLSDWNSLEPKYQTIAVRKGFDALDRAMRADREASVAYTKVQTVQQKMALFSQEQKEKKEYGDWTAEELLHGKVVNGTSYETPWGVKGKTDYGYPDWALTKIYDAKLAAFNSLKPYIETGITKADVSKAISSKEPKADIVKMISRIDRDIINVPKAAQAGKDADLRLLGVSAADIKTAKTISTEEATTETKIPRPMAESTLDTGQIVEVVKQTGKGMWESTKGKGETFTQGWQDNRDPSRIISNEEHAKIPRDSIERDHWTRTTPENVSRGLRLAAETLIPGIYTARHWSEMGTGAKAFSIALDVITLVPIGLVAGRAARTIGTAASVGKRLSVTGEAMGEEALRQVRAPIDVIIHPIESTKNVGRMVRDLAELINDPARLPSVTLGTADGLVAFRCDKNTTQAEWKAIRDELVELSKAGHKPIVIAGGKKYELAVSSIIKEQGGGLVHSAPDIGWIEESGAKVKYVAGKPLEEQGWFLSTGGAPTFVERSAFGTGQIPLPATYDSKVRAVAKYKPTDLVRLDKQPIRELNLADIKSVPERLAKPIENYVRDNDGRITGSFVQWLKVKGAAKPNDLDLVFRDRHKAIDDLFNIAKANGFTAKKVTKGVEILQDGKWVRVAEVRSAEGYKRMIPKGLTPPPNKIKGVNVTTLGEQYLRQSYGAVTPDLKAGKRLKALQKAAGDVKNMLVKEGAQQRRPGYFIISKETAEAKAIPTGKLYPIKSKHPVAEMEEKFPVGAGIPMPKQALYTRLGPFSERAEILLEKPLSKVQIAKLKAKGLIDFVETPFKQPLKITEVKRAPGKSLTNAKVKQLSNTLKQSGFARQAQNLLRAQRIAMAPRRVAPALTRVLGNIRMAKGAAPSVIRAEITRLERTRAEVTRLEARTPARPTREQTRELERVKAELDKARRKVVDRVSQARVETARAEPTRGKPTREIPARAGAARGEPPRGKSARTEAPRTISARETPPRVTPAREEPARVPPPRVPPPRVPPPKIPPPRVPPYILPDIGIAKKEWTPKEIKSAIAWKRGIVVHAIKAPYRPGDLDKASFNIHHLPAGLVPLGMEKGKGSPARSLKSIAGKPPASLNVDVGLTQDQIRFSHGKARLVTVSERKTTPGGISIKRQGRNTTAGNYLGIRRQGRIIRG